MEVSGPVVMYLPGDPLVIERFQFVHEMNVSQVQAIFKHEDGEHKIELSGVPENRYPDQIIPTIIFPRRLRYGLVSLRGVVGPDALPGEYQLVALEALSEGEQTIRFHDTPDLRFKVVVEPERPPHIMGQISLGQRVVSYPVRAYDEGKDDYIYED